MKIAVYNRQRGVRFNLRWLREFAAVALKRCRGESADDRFHLSTIPEVELTIVSNRVMAGIHQRFMNVKGPTDVITFEHGEIVMSADEAKESATHYRHSVEEELALYSVHGLLHLNGFEDATPQSAAQMRKAQSRVIKACLAEMPLA